MLCRDRLAEDARMYPGQTLKSASGACSAALTDDGDFQIACAGDAVPRWNASGLTDFCGTIIYSTRTFKSRSKVA